MLMLTNLVFIANIISNLTSCCLYNSQANWTNSVRIYEYVTNANPIMSEVPIKIFTPDLHEQGPSSIIQFDLSRELQTDYPRVLKNLKSKTTLRDATEVILKQFEAPKDQSDPVLDTREASAQDILDELIRLGY